MADRNRSLEFGLFLSLCETRWQQFGQFLDDFLNDFLYDFLCENFNFLY